MPKLLIVVLAVGLSVASAKTYDVQFTSAVKVGSMDLRPGKYTIAVMDESKVRFTDANGKVLEASANVSTGDKKFQSTTVDSKEVNGVTQISEIDLGGSKTKIVFQ